MPAVSADEFVIQLDQIGLEPHITVMLGILLVSLFAVSFPSVSKQVSFLRIPHLVFFIGKHFGTGAILSTAFCHLLPDAFESLQNTSVNERYNGIGQWAGAIILGSLLTIFLVEYISTSYVDHLHAEPSAPSSPASSQPPSRPRTPQVNVVAAVPADTSTDQYMDAERYPTMHHPLPAQATPPLHHFSPPPETTHVTETTPLVPKRSRSLCSFDHSKDEPLLPLIVLNSPRLFRGGPPNSGLLWGRDMGCVCPMGRMALLQACEVNTTIADGDTRENRERDVKPKVGRKRQIVGILILQLGIMIHSLVIGLTLAVTSGTDFTSLVTAIVFHQLFEGLSLGIRISGLPPSQTSSPSTQPRSSSSSFPSTRDSPHISDRYSWRFNWLNPVLSILFAITTPLGMVIGLFVFASSDIEPSPEHFVRVQLIKGLMSGISAGMLIYAATVEMLAGDFVFGDVGGDHGHAHDHGHEHGGLVEKKRSGMLRRVLAVVSLLAGTTTMVLVGLGE